MSVALVLLWILVGWCVIPWPRHWPWPYPPGKPQPDPWALKPDPNPWVWKVLGALGGVAGGWLFAEVWVVEGGLTAIDAAATSIGAWCGSVLLNELFGLVRPLPKA